MAKCTECNRRWAEGGAHQHTSSPPPLPYLPLVFTTRETSSTDTQIRSHCQQTHQLTKCSVCLLSRRTFFLTEYLLLLAAFRMFFHLHERVRNGRRWRTPCCRGKKNASTAQGTQREAGAGAHTPAMRCCFSCFAFSCASRCFRRRSSFSCSRARRSRTSRSLSAWNSWSLCSTTSSYSCPERSPGGAGHAQQDRLPRSGRV